MGCNVQVGRVTPGAIPAGLTAAGLLVGVMLGGNREAGAALAGVELGERTRTSNFPDPALWSGRSVEGP
ncbi:hypothetical protein [Nocardia testacea]|uniref:Uncharacterized protein n=1 Tax=Nocardia testacea TaxID=248551 RepID=A0ABW7W7R9_9NOCA